MYRAKVTGPLLWPPVRLGREATFSFSVFIFKTETNPNSKEQQSRQVGQKPHALKRENGPQIYSNSNSNTTVVGPCGWH